MLGMSTSTISCQHLVFLFMAALMGEHLYLSYNIQNVIVYNVHDKSFSRKIIWLTLATTNRDPAVTLGYFLDSIHT